MPGIIDDSRGGRCGIRESMRHAVSAGVDTIEHGFGGTSEVFNLMAPSRTVNLAVAE